MKTEKRAQAGGHADRLLWLLVFMSGLWLPGSIPAEAQGSVLSTGSWWKLAVEKEGVYRLTTAEVPALQGAAVDRIGIYGMGGGMLSTSNAATPYGDLHPLTIEVNDRNGNGLFDSGDEVLFYCEGADRWLWSEGDQRWIHERHAYDSRGYYFLTTSATGARRIETEPATGAQTEVTAYTAVACIDNDLVNLFSTGQKWMGESFSTSMSSRSFTLQLSGNAGEGVKLRYALASRSTALCQFSIRAGSYSNYVGISSQGVYTTVLDAMNTSSSEITFNISYTAGESAAAGYLDFIEASAQAPLVFNGGQCVLRMDPTGTGTARYVLGGETTGVRVWSVTGGQWPVVGEMAVEGGTWTDSTGGARLYVAFDGSSFLTPVAVTAVANQNLHGCEWADMVLVSHETLLDEARRLATLHEIFDGISTLVVSDRQVFNEYSSGRQDPMALRCLLRDMKSRHGEAPRWMLIMGDATYDPRHLTGEDGSTTVVVYESPYSFDEDGVSYCSDDILGYLSPTGHGGTTETLEVGIGRLPAKNVSEAQQMVDKIEGYLTRRDLLAEGQHGDWRNYVALLADDADPGHPYDSAFAHSSEVVASNINSRYPHLNIDKLYADAYHQSSGAIGSYYPDLNNALRKRINNGCLLLNYIGHGSVTYIGTERYIELSDVETYSNTDRLPLFVTSTCSYGRYDQKGVLSGAEACLLAPAAAVAVISASRPISHVERFNNDVVCFALDPHNTIGDALRMAKNRTSVAQSIGLTGDPALRLSQPENRVVVTHINTRAVSEGVDDTATVLSRVTVRGEVQDSNGVLLTDFDGTIYPIVFDRSVQSSTLANDNPGTEVTFTQQKNILYRGSHPVEDGRFEYSFVVPLDVAYQYDYAKLSHYAKSATDHATGCYTQLLLGGLDDTASIGTTPPAIRLFIGDTNFRDGGITDASPTLVALLSDSTGINAGSGLGHDITAILDGNPGSLVVLNDLYEPDVEHNGCGTVNYRFADLAPGNHTLTLKAWNIYNISAEASINFTVYNPDTLILSEMRCYPNPARGRTQFVMEINNKIRVATVELQIYSSRGQLVLTHTPTLSSEGYTVGPVTWDLTSVPAGLYLARFLVTDTDGRIYQQSTKCIVR